MTVLVLTSDLALSSRVAAAGARMGVPVQTAFSIEALLEKAAVVAPRLVLVDLTLPGLDPRKVVERLHSLDRPPTSIIACGPHVQDSLLSAAVAAGCDIVLTRGQFHAGLDDLLAGTSDKFPRD